MNKHTLSLMAISLFFILGGCYLTGKPLKHSKKNPLLVWQFKRAKLQRKYTQINLRVGKRHLHLDKILFRPQVLSKHSYAKYQVPNEALTACAGQSDSLRYCAYVIQKGDSMYVYKIYNDTESVREDSTLIKRGRLFARWHVDKN